MITIAMTAVIMAAVGGILVSTLEADQRVADALQVEKQGYGVLSLMRRDFEACTSYAFGGPAFVGQRGTAAANADAVNFVTAEEGDPDPTTGRRPKLQKIGYKLQADASGNSNGLLSLYRAADPYTKVTDDPLSASTYAVVATGLKSLKLSYLDPKDNSWKDDEWKETDRVPRAVRITLEIVPASSQQDGTSNFGLVPTTTFSSTVGLSTVFAPLADQDTNTPPH